MATATVVDPHRGMPAISAGTPLEEARAAAILVHGRGGSARDMLSLAARLDRRGIAWLAPQAAGGSWYPLSFLAPLDGNQPHLDSALAALGRVVDDVGGSGPGVHRLALIGFSQGACLALELVARRADRFGAVAGLTGGLIGPPGTGRSYPGSLDGTPVFLGAGDPDPHVPWARVEETAEVLGRMGGAVEVRRYPGMPHTINDDEIGRLDELISALVEGGEPRASRDDVR